MVGLSGTVLFVYSDETDVGAGRVIKGRDGVTSLGPLTRWATALPGASLQALHVSLSSFSETLSGCALQWLTDNRNVSSIIRTGSTKRDPRQLALSI